MECLVCKSAAIIDQFLRFGLTMFSGPRAMRQGDSVIALYGSRWPVILRQQGDEWRLLGAAYIDGIMNGEIEKHKSAYEANAKYIIR
jgi:hypothetical protein